MDLAARARMLERPITVERRRRERQLLIAKAAIPASEGIRGDNRLGAHPPFPWSGWAITAHNLGASASATLMLPLGLARSRLSRPASRRISPMLRQAGAASRTG